MDGVRFGSDVRLLRRHRGWSQERLAVAIDRSRWVVSEIEASRGDRFAVGVLTSVAIALGGHLTVRLHYQGEGLDRLRDRAHARQVEIVVRELVADGWEVATEVSFNVYGERGVIDVLAFHAETGSVLVIEIKTVVPDIGGMLATLDRKVRHAAAIAKERGWAARTVSRLLVIRDSTTTRRRVADHSAIFAATFPVRNVAVRRWLRHPEGRLHGLRFLPDAGPTDARARRGAPGAPKAAGPPSRQMTPAPKDHRSSA